MVLHNTSLEYRLLCVPWGENNHDTVQPPGVTITPVVHSGERASQKKERVPLPQQVSDGGV